MPQYARILWWGNVRKLTYEERVAFAAEHQFNALNISPADIDALLDAGETLDTIRRTAERAGVGLTYLDPVVDWLPDWRPDGAAAEMIPLLDHRPGRALDDAAALGIDRVLAVTCFPKGRFSIDEVAPHLARFADNAADRGITVVLEAMPIWGFPRFADMVALRAAADRPNIALLFDTWHYFRSGRSDALLEALPEGAIDHVQIAAGADRTPAGRSLFDDCLLHRRPPGERELPLGDLLSQLKAAGHLTSVGPEVFSAELDALFPAEIAQRLLPPFEKLLAGTGLERPLTEAA